MARNGPGRAEPLDLLGLQLVEWNARVFAQKRRAHQIHSLFGRPLGGPAGPRTPPNPLPQTVRVRLDSKQPGWVGEHWSRVRRGKTLALQSLQEGPRVLACHVGLIGAIGRIVAKIAIALDDLFRGSTADAELQAPARDE